MSPKLVTSLATVLIVWVLPLNCKGISLKKIWDLYYKRPVMAGIQQTLWYLMTKGVKSMFGLNYTPGQGSGKICVWNCISLVWKFSTKYPKPRYGSCGRPFKVYIRHWGLWGMERTYQTRISGLLGYVWKICKRYNCCKYWTKMFFCVLNTIQLYLYFT